MAVCRALFALAVLASSLAEAQEEIVCYASLPPPFIAGLTRDGEFLVQHNESDLRLRWTNELEMVGVPLSQAYVSRAPDNSCILNRTYENGVVTREIFSSGWSLEVLPPAAFPREHVVVTTNMHVAGWQPGQVAWWAPLELRVDDTSEDVLGLFHDVRGTDGRRISNYTYGGLMFENEGGRDMPPVINFTDPGLVLPVFAWFDEAVDMGLSLAMDPSDSTTHARLVLTDLTRKDAATEALFSFRRDHLSVGGNSTGLTFSGGLHAGPACWRSALAHFDAIAEPFMHQARVSLPGGGSYAYYFGQKTRTADHYQNMDLRVNWDASFPWIYHGPWVPFPNNRGYFPLADAATSATCMDDRFCFVNCDPAGHGGHAISTKPVYPACINTSYTLLNSWYKELANRLDIATLMYGTVEEFGFGIEDIGDPVPACEQAASNYSAALACGANTLLRDRFPGAIVRSAAHNGSLVHAAWSSVIMDMGDDNYAQFMLENTERVVHNFSSASGVCLDRGDWIGLVNLGRDDGVTMTPDGRVGAALVNSWKQLIPAMASILHGSQKALFVNPDMGHRADMYQDVDGFFDELGDAPGGGWRTGTAWLAHGGRPGIIWCHDPKGSGGMAATKCGAMMTNGTDMERHRFLQTHLLLGLYPTIPFEDNDHELQPAPRADAFYQQYGKLFASLHGSSYALFPHVVSVVSGVAQANVFKLVAPRSYALALVFATDPMANITVVVRNLPEIKGSSRCKDPVVCQTMFPGWSESVACSVSETGPDFLVIDVPMALDRNSSRGALGQLYFPCPSVE